MKIHLIISENFTDETTLGKRHKGIFYDRDTQNTIYEYRVDMDVNGQIEYAEIDAFRGQPLLARFNCPYAPNAWHTISPIDEGDLLDRAIKLIEREYGKAIE